MQETIKNLVSPQLEKIHSGKVRESYRLSTDQRMIVVTDRISCFDQILETTIPNKGAVLNQISNFWFEKTTDIIDNHLIEEIDPNVNIVCEASPIRVEMVVRGYVSGSMWRRYQKGDRIFSGTEVKDGLSKNEKLPDPLLTPTTKEAVDREISPEEIISSGLIDANTYAQMAHVASELFSRGTKLLSSLGIILVDTKYEFGLLKGKLILIDEIHTPDSSRFWDADKYKISRETVEQIDKEFVREWLMANKEHGVYPRILPPEIVRETEKRYQTICKKITERVPLISTDPLKRIHDNLRHEGLIKDGFVALVMGSAKDLDHAKTLKQEIEKYDIFCDLRVVSAHKNGERIQNICAEYNQAFEPGAVIAIAGLSNGLGGALAANLTIPVFNNPPHKDLAALSTHLNSSLFMPTHTPVATVIHAQNAAEAALKSLNLKRLKNRFAEKIAEMKEELKTDDDQIRSWGKSSKMDEAI
jgi:phosphoribosylaminoimidazole-succinocarboxamide synthase